MILALRQMIEQIKQQNSEFSTESKALLLRLDNLPSSIENTALVNNERIKENVSSELRAFLKMLSDEQERYILALQNVQKALSDFEYETEQSNNTLKDDINTMISNRNLEVINAQERYINEINNVNEAIKNCESELEYKYKDFLSVLNKINASSLYEQNVQLKNEMNKKTGILMIISIVSVIVSIVGLFM